MRRYPGLLSTLVVAPGKSYLIQCPVVSAAAGTVPPRRGSELVVVYEYGTVGKLGQILQAEQGVVRLTDVARTSESCGGTRRKGT